MLGELSTGWTTPNLLWRVMRLVGDGDVISFGIKQGCVSKAGGRCLNCCRCLTELDVREHHVLLETTRMGKLHDRP